MPFRIRLRPQVFRTALLAGSLFTLLAAAHPNASSLVVFNNTQSLMVESLDQNGEGYNLSLRSNSPVAVAGVAIAAIDENGVCDLHTLGALKGSYIVPSGSRALPTLAFPDPAAGGWGPRMGACSEGAVPGSPSDIPGAYVATTIIIEAVNFEDGTFEGDRAISAILEARRLARRLQWQRIGTIVTEDTETIGPEDHEWVEVLQTQVAELPVEPDADTVHLLQLRFSPSAVTENAIREEFRSWLIFERGRFLNHLRMYVTESSHKGLPIVSLRDWWNATKGECDFFWPECRNGTL